MPWSGALHGRAPERFVQPEPAAPPLSESLVAGAGTGRAAPAPPDTLPPADALVLAAATDMGSSEPTPGETEEPAENREPAGLDVAVLARIADALQPAATTAVVPAAVEGLGAAESLPQPNAQPAAVDTSSPNPVIPADVAPEPQPAARAAPEPEATAPEPAAAVRQPASEREFDEDAAMRAIEGGWSRRDARALPDAPELTDVTAAVSAAQVAVEQVLARSGIAPAEAREHAAFGKPRGLPHARNGLRDDLKQIAGLGPLDESALNNLGIYHFDQIAGWDEREVLWLENHAFARGRIGREQWQAQARALASGAAEPRARR
jgi:predicted flap endonuclease-1-like 5' DNA nuclease